MSHVSDLALERLLCGESCEETQRHLEECAVCWERWCALHAHEGLPRPSRPPASRSRTGWLPWVVVGAGGLMAAAAAAAVVVSTGAPSEVVELRQEVQSLKSEIAELEQAASERREVPPKASGGVTPKLAPKKPGVEVRPEKARWSSASDGASQKPQGDGAAWADKREAFAAMRDKKVAAYEQIAREAVDALYEELELTDDEARRIEQLLVAEFDETWQIKSDVVDQSLDGSAGTIEWKELRESTDSALLDILSEDELAELREHLDGGGK